MATKARTLEQELTALDRLFKDQAAIGEHVKAQLLDRIHGDIAQLKRLGHFYSLVPTAKMQRGGKAAMLRAELKAGMNDGKTPGSRGIGFVADKICRVCGFKTAPLHDARRHRAVQLNSGKMKTPRRFTEAELAELGMQRAPD